MSEPIETKVLSLSTGEPITEIIAERRCDSYCKRVVVDRHQRKLFCHECGKDIDLFVWCDRMARDESALMQRIRMLETELKQSQERLDRIKEEEKRVKARISSAKQTLLRSAGI